LSYDVVVGMVTRLWPRLSGVRFLAEVKNFYLVLNLQMTLRFTESCFEPRGYRRSRTILLLHLWNFLACYRVNFTFLPLMGKQSVVKLTIYLLLVSRFQMCADRFIFLYMPSWHVEIQLYPFIKKRKHGQKSGGFTDLIPNCLLLKYNFYEYIIFLLRFF